MFSSEYSERYRWEKCLEFCLQSHPESAQRISYIQSLIRSQYLDSSSIAVVQSVELLQFPNAIVAKMPSFFSLSANMVLLGYSPSGPGTIFTIEGKDISKDYPQDLLQGISCVALPIGVDQEEIRPLVLKALQYRKFPQLVEVSHFVRPSSMLFCPGEEFSTSKLQYFETAIGLSKSPHFTSINEAVLLPIFNDLLSAKAGKNYRLTSLSEVTPLFVKGLGGISTALELVSVSRQMGQDFLPILCEIWQVLSILDSLFDGDQALATEIANDIRKSAVISKLIAEVETKLQFQSPQVSPTSLTDLPSPFVFYSPSGLASVTPASIVHWYSLFTASSGYVTQMFDFRNQMRTCIPLIFKDSSTIIVTGACGFIGANLCASLLDRGFTVVGIDNINPYYSVNRKISNLRQLQNSDYFFFHYCDIRDLKKLKRIVALHSPISAIVHLAAQAGVRYSLENPAIVDSINRSGTLTIFNLAVESHIKTVVYASSSSVYGEVNGKLCKEDMELGVAKSPYALTKRANERDAKKFCEENGINAIGLRFFTVGGPMVGGEIGRPDMALATFIRKLLKGEPITMYGGGKFTRDFTYVEDVVQGITLAVQASLEGRVSGHEVFNIAEGETTSLARTVLAIAQEMGIIKGDKRAAEMNDEEIEIGLNELKEMRLLKVECENPADVSSTFADISKARKLLGFDPKVSIFDSIRRCVLKGQMKSRAVSDDERRIFAEAFEAKKEEEKCERLSNDENVNFQMLVA